MATETIEYQCCFCDGTVSSQAKSSLLDPCTVVLIAHFDENIENQKEQQFFCHFECFRKAAPNVPFYIDQPDFPARGETD
jgi:hypothetical protein